MIEPSGDDSYVVDSCPGCVYLVGVGSRKWGAPGEAVPALFVGRVDTTEWLLERYAIMDNVLDETDRVGDPINPNEMSHFGSAYTIDNNDGQGPRVLFAANANNADNDPNTWWGLFELELGFSVPDGCWNTGFRAYGGCSGPPYATNCHKECTPDNFPGGVPTTTISWVGLRRP